MGEKIIQPPFYNSGFYDTGSGGGGGGGPQYTENIVLLLNGITDTNQPITGSVTPSIDNDFPIENLKVFSSANCTTTGVYYDSNIPIDNIFTLDFWFKGISHSLNITPFFIGLSRLNLNDYMLSTNYNDDLTNFLWDGWITGLNRFVMQKGIWHHLCVESRPVDASHDERFLFVDGQMKKHSLSVSGLNWNELKLNFGGGYNKTLYEIGQICIRNSIVWEQDFTPPNYAYSLY
jgi:hypothetical protein